MIGIIVMARSTVKISAEISVISLPELVSVKDFIDRTATLSYIADTIAFLICTAITYDK